MKLLIVEDELELGKSMVAFFKNAAAIVLNSENRFDAEDKLLGHQFDIIILDITLPDGNGLDLINLIKKTQENAGILIVSAKNSLDDKVMGLDLGADDYITKPFHLAELNSRVNALMRRKFFNGEAVLSFEEISVNTSQNQAYVNAESLILTPKEFSLLLYFIVNKNRVLTKESIAEHLWGDSLELIENFDFIYAHIKNLRKKIEALGGNDYIQTVHGMGYKYSLS